MSIASLIRAMGEAGATPEAIALAVDAIEAEKAKDAARRAKRADDRKRQRADKAATVARQGGDKAATVAASDGDNGATAPSEVPPKDNISNPSPTTLEPSLRSGSARKRAPAKRKTGIAEDAQPDEAQRKVAAEFGLSVPEFRHEWAKFRDYHRKHGNLFSDWVAAWRSWLRKRPEIEASNARAGPRQSQTGVLTRLMMGQHHADEPDFHPPDEPLDLLAVEYNPHH